MDKIYTQCLRFFQVLRRIATTNHFGSIYWLPAERVQMPDGWLSANGLIGYMKMHTL